MACEDYKKTKSPVKMAEKAKKIYEEFIQTEAPKEVSGHGAGDGTGRDQAAALVASIPKESDGCRAPRTTAEGLGWLYPRQGAAPSPRAALPPFTALVPLFARSVSAGLPPATGTSSTCLSPSPRRGLTLIIRDDNLQ